MYTFFLMWQNFLKKDTSICIEAAAFETRLVHGILVVSVPFVYTAIVSVSIPLNSV